MVACRFLGGAGAVILLLCPSMTALAETTLSGIVLENRLGGRPVADVTVTAEGTNPKSTTASGKFTLTFGDKGPGDQVRLVVNRPGSVVVNDIQLEISLPSKSNKQELIILICPERERDRWATEFYRVRIKERLPTKPPAIVDRLATELATTKTAELTDQGRQTVRRLLEGRLDAELALLGSQEAILLGDVHVADICPQAGVDRNKVRSVAESFLSRDRRFRPRLGHLVEELANTATRAVREVGTVSAQQTNAGGSNIRTVGADLYGLGFASVLVVEVECARSKSGDGWSTTFVTRSLNARAVGDVSSSQESLTDLVDKRSVTAGRDLELADALRRSMAPLVRISMLTFGAAEAAVRRGDRLPVLAYLPDTTLPARAELRAKLVDDSQEREQCTRANAIDSLRGNPFQKEPLLEGPVVSTADFQPGGGEPREILLNFVPHVPGEYLLQVGLASAGSGFAYRCVRTATIGRVYPWLVASAGGSLYRPTSTGRPENFRSYSVLLGLERGSAAAAALAWSAVVGYSRSQHEGLTPPSWNAVGMGLTLEDGGKFAHRWSRNAVLLGAGVSVRALRLADHGWRNSRAGGSGLDLRLLAAVDLGRFSLDDASQMLPEFRQSDGGWDASGSGFVQAEVTVGFSPTIRVFAGASLGALGVNNLLIKNYREGRELGDTINIVLAFCLGVTLPPL